MRIASVVIGLSVVAYIAWKGVALPAGPGIACPDNANCREPAVLQVSSSQPPSGLHVELYDPIMEPRRRYEDETPYPGWTPGAESDPAVIGEGDRARFRRRYQDFNLAWLRRPESPDICSDPDGGMRQCGTIIAR